MATAVSRNIGEVLDGLDKCRQQLITVVRPAVSDRIPIGEVLLALQSFTEIVRYLNTRRSRGAILELVDEASVQDALYLMLRPWIHDLTPESPTDRVANSYSIKDFVSHSNKFVLEAKFIRDKSHGKTVVTEINDDIETYRYHASCGIWYFLFMIQIPIYRTRRRYHVIFRATVRTMANYLAAMG